MDKQNKVKFLLVAAGIGLSLAAMSAAAGAIAPTQTISHSPALLAQKSKLNSAEILQAHNKYRQEVGVTALKWSDGLANSAQQWANRLASTRAFQHSNTGGKYGENIWMGSSGYFSQTQMVDTWGAEKQYFIPNSVFPNTCKGGWQKCGHYTQIIWKNTTEVGCGLASGGGNDYLVCQYTAPGNYQGQKPF